LFFRNLLLVFLSLSDLVISISRGAPTPTPPIQIAAHRLRPAIVPWQPAKQEKIKGARQKPKKRSVGIVLCLPPLTRFR
jgi:hypothetical protein